MIRRILAVLAAFLLVPAVSLAELRWKEETPALTFLKQYTESINKLLTEHGESPVNSLFSVYARETVMGITEKDNSEIPEAVEITVKMYYDTLNSLELRVSDIRRFPVIAAAVIKAFYGDAMTWEDALLIPEERASRALKNPDSSFEEPVDDMNGNVPRVYYSYHPDPYRNGIPWIQMTLIFPLAGEWDGNGLILGTQDDTPFNDPADEGDPDYEGYFMSDDYTHLETFATATPEPDSAAAEYDFR